MSHILHKKDLVRALSSIYDRFVTAKPSSKCPDFTTLADSETLWASLWEVCQHSWLSNPVHKGPQVDWSADTTVCNMDGK